MDGMTDTAQQQLRAQPRLTRPDGSPIRIVVVDDEQSLADLVAMGLKYEGWDVKTAANGQQALQADQEAAAGDVSVVAQHRAGVPDVVFGQAEAASDGVDDQTAAGVHHPAAAPPRRGVRGA